MKRNRHRGTLVASGLLLLAGCVASVRPAVLDEMELARASAAGRLGEQLAPQAFKRAEQLREQSVQAHEQREAEASEILGQHALVAYERAAILARLATAETRLARAQTEVQTAEARLVELDKAQMKVAAEAQELELKARVERDAVPLVPNAPADPKREAARRETAQALSTQARLLCAAVQMLDPKHTQVATALSELDKLDQTLSAGSGVPIDDAIRLRSKCLEHLTGVRHEPSQKAPETGLSDQLLEQLGSAGLKPHRDDRGVVVTLRDLFAAKQFTDPGKERLRELAQVAKAHAQFPVLVVAHSARARRADQARQRAAAVAAQLQEFGAPRVQSITAGSALPLVPARLTGAAQKNDRIEIVFVSPST